MSGHSGNGPVLEAFQDSFGTAFGPVRVVRSPYRICPLGAHIDHQLGRVTALAIDRHVEVAFAPSGSKECRVRSLDFPGEVTLSLDDIGERVAGDWGNYLRGAARALGSRFPLEQGIVAVTRGNLADAGLSSSAAIGVAYLLALQHANGLQVPAWDNVELDRIIENEYLGLRNGILDQAAILLSKRNELTVIDCHQSRHDLIPLPSSAPSHRWLIAGSGLRQSLVTTGYNLRVEECRAAAAVLLQAAGREGVSPLLGNVDAEEYKAHGHLLTGLPARRARHFYSESERVAAGIAAWAEGDLGRFGQLMAESGLSSIENYECGAPPIIDLYRILISTPGVLGARFSGAGFRGCCIALVTPEHAVAAAGDVLNRYRAAQPAFAGEAFVELCRSANGAAIL